MYGQKGKKTKPGNVERLKEIIENKNLQYSARPKLSSKNMINFLKRQTVMVRNERYDFNSSGKIILPHNKVEVPAIA